MRTTIISLVIFSILATMTYALAQTDATPIRMAINEQWQFRKLSDTTWRMATVPGTIHGDLLKYGLIPDPFYRANEDSIQWVDMENWEYRTVFTVEEELFQKKNIDLIFKGLDTYAEVFVNDSLVLRSDNMFREWRVSLKPAHSLLKLGKGANTLRVILYSPLQKALEPWKALGYELPGGIRTVTRKAAFHYGWDWGPRIVTSGIWRPVELEGWDELHIQSVYYQQHHIEKDMAYVTAHLELESDRPREVTIRVDQVATQVGTEVKALEQPIKLGEKTLQVAAGSQVVSVDCNIKNPQLWWTHDHGPQNLYPLKVTVEDGRTTLDTEDKTIGVREIKLVQEKDSVGYSFYFKLNGHAVFAKGANYIPQHSLQSAVTPEDTRKLLEDAVAANMNMLRVWGGGIYEEDDFYRRCDELGLMIWQDFMFACAMYPGDEAFLESVRHEAEDNIRRLRNHACIALWCGNNENNEAWHNWGWQPQFSLPDKEKVWKGYQDLFNGVLPAAVEKLMPGAPYWESSPRYGRADKRSMTEGDSHYWGVWHDAEPFSEYEKKVPRFMSEYGFQSFPEWSTLESFTLEQDRELLSPVMLLHQKHPRGNQLIEKYTGYYFNKPKDFRSFAYVSQLVQAEGMRTAIEAHRRAKPYCMGSLYWQLNDCWPVASWSGRDSKGRWKALHYYAREAFNPVMLSPVQEDGMFKVWVVSDRFEPFECKLEVSLHSFYASAPITLKQNQDRVPANSSSVRYEMPISKWLPKDSLSRNYVLIKLKEGDKVVASRVYYFLPPKDLHLPEPKCAVAVAKTGGKWLVELNSNVLIKNALLEANVPGHFEHNYFDVLPGEKATVLFTPEKPVDALEVSVTCLQDACEKLVEKKKPWWKKIF